MKTIYYAVFNSLTCYGILGWGGSYKTFLKKLENRQRRIINIFNFGKSDDIFLSIKQNFYYFSVRKEYLCIKNIYLNNERKNERTITTSLPKFTKEIRKKDYYYCAIKIFNMLPKHLKTPSSKEELTNSWQIQVKKWLSTINSI